MTARDPIERIVLTHLRVPFKEPYPVPGGELATRDAILVEVVTDSATGLGECSAMPELVGPSDQTPERCWDELAGAIAPALLGRALDSAEEIAETAAAWSTGRPAAAAAETALWDLLGQARHASISEMLGASDIAIDKGVESGLSLACCPSVVSVIQLIEAHLAAGYRRVKVPIQPGLDVELVRSIRQHFGELQLQVDGRGSYTLADLDALRELDDLDLLMIEQPMAADDLDGLAELQDCLSTPISLSETARDLEHVARAIDRGAGRIVKLSLQCLGGLAAAVAVHNLCRQRDVACWVGSTPELGIAQAHAIHLATLPGCKYPSDIEPSSRWFVDDYTIPLVEMASPGVIEVPTRPGLGFHVDPVKVKRYQVRQQVVSSRASG